MKAKTSRRVLAMVLTVVMILALIPAAFAGTFQDVPEGIWYEKAVEYCAENKLMSGTGEGFNPMGTVSREQAVQTMYALAGSPAVAYEPLFTDIPEGQWYTKAVIWGAKNNLVAGTGDGLFGLGQAVTREQVATFFYRYGDYIRVEEDFASINKFPDKDKVSSWSKTAVQWAVAKGILSGQEIDGVSYLNPQGKLMRCELASILMRFHPICLEAEGACEHENTELRNEKPATCTEDGYTGDLYCLDCGRKLESGEIIKASGHVDEDPADGFCDNCNLWLGGDKEFTLTDSLTAGTDVVIYNPGHGMAIKNETDNDWYLVPETVTPEDGKFINPDESLVWHVVDNGDGSYGFTNGDNKIMMWISGTYFELTNNADYSADQISGNWLVKSLNAASNLFVIYSAEFTGSYGPAYLECYYNSNKDTTKISGFSASDSRVTENDFGFQFYSFGIACSHKWDDGKVVAPTCTDKGYTLFTCLKCGATRKDNEVAALGHIDENPKDGFCDRCGAEMGDIAGEYVLSGSIKGGDKVVIYNPGHGMVITNATDNNWYLVPRAEAPVDSKYVNPAEDIVWTVNDNGDGTFSFTNGDNKIMMWVSEVNGKTYFELTNDANYANADGSWKVTFNGDIAYIQHATFSNSFGPAYIECYYNANKDVTNISGYSSSSPSANDFGFQFYVKDGSDVPPVPPVPPTPSGEYALTNALKSGDEVVIYNAGNGKAVSTAMNGYYVAGVDVTPADNVISDPDAAIVWTVTVNANGTYTFKNGSFELSADSTYNESQGKTYNNLYTAAGHKNTWTLETLDAATCTFTAYNAEMEANYGHIYLEWYEAKAGFSAYDTSADRATEQNFGFRFYVKDGEPVPPPVPSGLPFEDGDCVVLYNPASGTIVGYDEDTDYNDGTGEYTYWNITTETASVNGTGLKADYFNAGTFYALINEDGTVSFLDQYDYDASEDENEPDCYFLYAEAPDTMYYDASSFEVIAADGGYLLKDTADGSYLYIENGLLYAGDLKDGDRAFIFLFASVDTIEEIDEENANIVCTILGDEPVPPVPAGDFVLAESVKDGDEVIIFNEANGKALPATIKASYYLDAVDITPAGDTISTDDASIIWKVTENSDGTYTFTNGTSNVLSINYNTDSQKTSFSLDGANPKMTLESAGDNNYYIYSATQEGKYSGGHIYVEWYAAYSEMSAYSTSADRVSVDNFGFKFFVKGGEPAPVCEHKNTETQNAAEATCTAAGYTGDLVCADCGKTLEKGEVIKALGHIDENPADGICDRCSEPMPVPGETFALTGTLNDGDLLLIYCPAANAVIGNSLNGTRAAAVAAAPAGDEMEAPEGAAVFTVTFADETNFYLVTEDGKYFTSAAAGNSVSFETAASDLGLWYLVPVDGGFHIMNKAAAYGGNTNQALEYYSSAFTTYGVKDTEIYLFQLFVQTDTCDHDWVQTDRTEATCTEAEHYYYECENCGKTKTEDGEPALGHDWIADSENDREPTCTEAGLIAFKCSRCTETKTEKGEAALGHIDENPADGKCDRCGKDMPTGAGFVKVTSLDDLTEGTYVIVYETDSIIMNGGLDKVDAAHNVVSVVIDENRIAADETTMAASFTFEKVEGGFAILAANGKYISGSASKNTITEGTSPVANEISFDEEGNATIFAGGYLMFNKTAGDSNYRFRYYKAQTQQAIQLYKLAD